MMADETLDTSGLLCPLPVLKAGKKLRVMAPGQILQLRASDPAAIVDIPHFCAQSGHEFISVADTPDGDQIYLIRRR